ncbi:MAG: DUF6922 domain-containing protein [Acidimicrobiales bacterium]
MSLPPEIADLLWNYDARSLDPEVSVEVVVLAVLRLGTWEQILWLFGHYGQDRVRGVIAKDCFGTRSLPVSVRAFWANVFWPDAPPPEIEDPMQRWRPTRRVL